MTTPSETPPSTARPANAQPVAPTGPGGSTPTFPAQTQGLGAPAGPTMTVATYTDYQSAQRAVDYLSDNQFPVERTAIVGTDLRLVERVLGRMTTARAALAGAASGAWFGLFIGLLFGLFSNSSWLAVLAVCILIGAVWGAIFGAIAHAMTGGRRDFTSRSMLQATHYAVIAHTDVAEEARQLLTRLNWQTANPQ